MITEQWAERPALDPGNDFEQRCWGLLRRRYKVQELVYMPADIGGDCGIEGYSTDGIAYQCYADRNSLTLRHRTDKQKKKLYDDTCKLQQYAERIAEALGPTSIKYYFLLVPEFHAVELITYANMRAEVVRSYSLSFVDPEFRIFVKTPHDYPAEMRAAMIDGAAKAIIPDAEVDESQVSLFALDKPDLVATLENKLAVAAGPAHGTDSLRDSFVRAFLRKDQIMRSLAEWPDTWEAVEARRLLYQEELEFENEFDTSDPRARLRDLISKYRSNLASSVAGIGEAEAQRIAYGQVGEWLMRCPLRLRAAQ